MPLIDDLKRRNVFRAGAAYLVASWVVIQVIDLAVDALGAPPWVLQFVLVMLATGFFVVIAVSWAYEITPQGIKPDGDVLVDDSFREEQAKRFNWLTIGLVFVAMSLVLVDRLYQSDQAASAAGPGTERRVKSEPGSSAPDKSIAVLPFIAMSPDVNDAYFGKGVAEELLNALAQYPSLKVAARTSTFLLAERGADLEEIGTTLNVAHVLEGSVRRSGKRLRIRAQLVNSVEGYHIWSKTYERMMTDVLTIQDEIVADISRILQIRLGVGAGMGRAEDRTVDSRAYELYLKGLDLWWTRDMEGHRAEAIAHFFRVTELAPDFDDGWAAYATSIALSNNSFAPHLDTDSYNNEIESAFSRALDINPENPRALAGLVYHHVSRRVDIPVAGDYLESALENAPNYPFTHYAAAQYYFAVGDELNARRAISRALIADPLNDTLKRIQFQHQSAFGEFQPDAAFLEGLEDCAESSCSPLDWLRAWTALVAALHAGTEPEIRQMRDTFQAVQEALGGTGDFGQDANEFLIAYADAVLGDDDHTAYWQETDFLNMDSVGHFVFDATILAQQGLDEQAIAIVERAMNTNRFFASRGITYVLSEGRFEMPDQIRRHPVYHKVWQSPGMPELEVARRGNGATAGLPLPAEQDPAAAPAPSPGAG